MERMSEVRPRAAVQAGPCQVQEEKEKLQAFTAQFVVFKKNFRLQTYPRRDRQTLPFLYKFGLKRTVSFEVVIKRTRGGEMG